MVDVQMLHCSPFHRQLHEKLCPLAYVICDYCSMELIRDQVR